MPPVRRKNEMVLWDMFNRFDAEFRHKLLLYNLTYWTSEEDVIQVLKDIVQDNVRSIKILEDQENGLSIGVCCASFRLYDATQQVINRLSKHGNAELPTNLDSSTTTKNEWVPKVVPFTKYEFTKLLNDATERGRLRTYSDIVFPETDNNASDFRHSKRNYERNEIERPYTFEQKHRPVGSQAYNRETMSSSYSSSNKSWVSRSEYKITTGYMNYGFVAPPFPFFGSFPFQRQPFYLPPPYVPPPRPNSPEKKSEQIDSHKIMADNKRLASEAIRKGTTAHINGSTAEAKRIFDDAITRIKNSNVLANDSNANNVLLWTLEDASLSLRQDVKDSPEKQNRHESSRKRSSDDSKHCTNRKHRDQGQRKSSNQKRSEDEKMSSSEHAHKRSKSKIKIPRENK